jgi:hypothetical protein
MAGNTTVYTSNRRFLPFVWTLDNVPADQSGKIDIAGLNTTLNEQPMPRKASVVSLVTKISAAITAGQMTVRLTKDGTNTGDTDVLDSSSGLESFKRFKPGVVTFNKNHDLGFRLSTTATFAPAGSIDVAIWVEVQDEAD